MLSFQATVHYQPLLWQKDPTEPRDPSMNRTEEHVALRQN